MLDNIRRKRSQVSVDLYKSVFLRLCAFSSEVLKLNLGKLRLSEKATKSFRYFGQGHLFSSEVCSIKNVEFKMLACSADIFIMGHQDRKNTQPRPETIESSFLLGETEVTQELYEAVMGTNPSYFQNRPQNPVENVSWFDVIYFCNELSKLQGLEECYEMYETEDEDEGGDEDESGESWEDEDESGEGSKYKVTCDFSKNGYRLPKEKEWEYAAKAGTQNRWAGTDKEDDLVDYAVYNEKSKRDVEEQTHPVKSKLPNEWGFYDMSANVSEWCWDTYAPDDSKPSAPRVIRGGGWGSYVLHLRSDCRGRNLPDYRYRTLGFRVCRTLV